MGSILNGCSLLELYLQGLSSSQNGTPGSPPTTPSSRYTLTVNVKGETVFGNLRVNVLNGRNVIGYDYVSSSRPNCTFTIPEGTYLVELKIGQSTLSQTQVDLFNNKSITVAY